MEESYDKPRQCVKKQRYHFANKGLYSQICGFSTSHVQDWSWTIKKAGHQRSDAFKLWRLEKSEKTLESPLDSKEIKSVNPKGNQSWILIGRIDAEAEAPVLWPPDAKSQLTGKDPDSGKDWRQKEKEVTEDEMVR